MYPYKLCISILLVLNFMKCESLNITTAYGLSGTGLLQELAVFVENNGGSKNAEQCIRDVLYWKKSFFAFDRWAVEMFDAGGKFPSGVLSGNLNSLGQFDQCLRVKYDDSNRNLKGKYCLAKLPLASNFVSKGFNYSINHVLNEPQINQRVINVDAFGNIFLNWAICIPNSCKTSEIRDLIDEYSKSIGVNIDSTFVTVPENMCSTDDKIEWTTIDWIALAFFITFVSVILLSTLYDLCAHYIRRVYPSYHNFLASFSIYTNTGRLLTINRSSSSLRSLHGIRVMSMFWVILGHRYAISLSFPTTNILDIIEWNETHGSTIIITGNLAVDSFFVLSGFLISYVFFKHYDKIKSFNLILFYLHRFLRLTPPLVAIVIIQTTLYKYMGSGPLWDLTYENLVKPCEENWWMALLYLQNYLSDSGLCVPQTWYICVDSQLYVLSPILIYPLIKCKKFGIANLIFWILAAQITVTTIVYLNDWSAILTPLALNNLDYLRKYYYASHMRATPWILGFAAGYAIYNTTKKEIKMNKLLILFLWMLSLAVMAAVIFGSKSLHSSDHIVNKLEDGTYNALARTGWAFSLIWIMFACVHGYGGPIDWFLSWRIWEILGRLSYAMYLTHVSLQFLMTFSSRVLFEFWHYLIFYMFLGDLIITILVSYIWVIAFESPFVALEKAIFYKDEPKAVESKDEPQIKPPKDEPQPEPKDDTEIEIKDVPRIEVKDEPQIEVKDEPQVEAQIEPQIEPQDELQIEANLNSINNPDKIYEFNEKL